MTSVEHGRLDEALTRTRPWKAWGPYVSERQWGSVREDTSRDGDAWSSLPHDHARSFAYEWGEDGMAGVSDDRQVLCLALAVWNGKDPILKERMFGLTNSEGNHGEDVKEYWFYLDSTPTHSWMRWLYKYPQAAFPYDDLVRRNRERDREAFEYELLDTGVFDDDRYFDVVVDYAKAEPEDLVMRVTVHNRGPEDADIHVLPTLWFRNTWNRPVHARTRPSMRQIDDVDGVSTVGIEDERLGEWRWWCDAAPQLLFTENETNRRRLYEEPNPTPFVKDGINDALVHGRVDAVNPGQEGTKVAAHYRLAVPAGGSQEVRVRLARDVGTVADPFADATGVLDRRRREADEFYETVTPEGLSDDARNMFRQAMAGMLWSKQYYGYDVSAWLTERGSNPLDGSRGSARNQPWYHLAARDIISMPDKWEYPWFAAWDLAFHAIVLTRVDVDFAKDQIELLLGERYLHPNGQIPAYEWNFSDVNPPVHARAAMIVYRLEEAQRGTGDLDFLRRVFNKLVANFTWWVNRKDPNGQNLFEGGFLGLDNIGVFDRSSPLPGGGRIEQADGTAWMAFYSTAMLEMAAELAQEDDAYGEMVIKFLEHFFWIAAAMDRAVEEGDLWDEEEGFFYDLIVMPDGRSLPVKIHSLVGLMPLAASTSLRIRAPERFVQLSQRIEDFLARNGHLLERIADPLKPGPAQRILLSPLNEDKLRRVLARMLDEQEFLSDFGFRSLSKVHETPFRFALDGQAAEVDYWPAESRSGMFGGNSNWRGPVWLPMNMLLLWALSHLHAYYGDDFRVEYPTGSGEQHTLHDVVMDVAERLTRIYLTDDEGRRAVYGGTEKFQTDPHWRDLLLFFEYFHGDDGAGLGASHQTGWTGLVALALAITSTEGPRAMPHAARLDDER